MNCWKKSIRKKASMAKLSITYKQIMIARVEYPIFSAWKCSNVDWILSRLDSHDIAETHTYNCVYHDAARAMWNCKLILTYRHGPPTSNNIIYICVCIDVAHVYYSNSDTMHVKAQLDSLAIIWPLLVKYSVIVKLYRQNGNIYIPAAFGVFMGI